MRPTAEHRSLREAWPPWFSNYVFVSETIVLTNSYLEFNRVKRFFSRYGFGRAEREVLLEAFRPEILSRIYQEELSKAKICTNRCRVETGGLAAAYENTTLGFFNNWEAYRVTWLSKASISPDS